MNYTKVIEKLIKTNFKTNEDFYKERDKQVSIAQKKIDEYNEKIKKLEEQKYEFEKTLNQLNIF